MDSLEEDLSHGNMGSQGLMNYTLMGDNVDLGTRLEGTNKENIGPTSSFGLRAGINLC
jgi:hypothetical protein